MLGSERQSIRTDSTRRLLVTALAGGIVLLGEQRRRRFRAHSRRLTSHVRSPVRPISTALMWQQTIETATVTGFVILQALPESGLLDTSRVGIARFAVEVAEGLRGILGRTSAAEPMYMRGFDLMRLGS